MAIFSINGFRFTGSRIKVKDQTVEVDGNVVNLSGQTVGGDLVGRNTELQKIDVVVHEGVVESIVADGSVTAKDVAGSVSAGGSVHCDRVGKGVDAGGSVTCDCVGGNVDAGGSVKCGRVQGNIDAGGSVRHA